MVVAAASGATAQSTAPVRTVGYIQARSALSEPWREVLISSLKEHGWVVGQNLRLELRYIESTRESARAAAEELARLKVEVIIVGSTVAALAVKEATQTVPIVMTTIGDPVGTGLVKSLAQPGGNVTGMTFIGTDVSAKQLELMREMVPGLGRVTVLTNPANASHRPRIQEIASACRILKLDHDVLEVRSSGDIDEAFRALAKRPPGALIVPADPLFSREAQRLARLAAEARLPAIYTFNEHVQAGGLMSYGANFPDLFRGAAGYVDRILRGAKPLDLPVAQPTKFELFINRKAARALGLTVPATLLIRADQIID